MPVKFERVSQFSGVNVTKKETYAAELDGAHDSFLIKEWLSDAPC